MQSKSTYMNRLSRYLALTCIVLVVGGGIVGAVPPMPGLGLKEPVHPRIHKVDNGIRSAAARRNGNGDMRGLVILAEYSNLGFQPENDRDGFDSLMNAVNYTYNNATGSVRKYYADQSNGLFDMQFDVVGPVLLPHEMAYYGTDVDTDAGDYDQYSADLVMDACFIADSVWNVDFSQYDRDGDGVIDFVFIIYAGYGQADGGASTTIWPHEWDIEAVLAFGYTNQSEYYCDYDPNTGIIHGENLPVLDGCTLMSYACSNERRRSGGVRNGIGTACHEFGHVLGLPDHYLTTYDPPMEDAGEEPYNWSVMSHGSYNNNGRTPPNLSVFDEYTLGWITPEQLSGYRSVTMPADGQTYYAYTDGTLSATSPDTIWYFENRQCSGWDEYLPGWGMLVWRVVYNEEDWNDNAINDYSTRLALQSADGVSKPHYSGGAGSQPGVPFPGSANVKSYQPVGGCQLTNISTNTDNSASFIFGSGPTDLEDSRLLEESRKGPWYDVLGRIISSQDVPNSTFLQKNRIIIW